MEDVLGEKNRTHLKKIGALIYLKASVKTLFERMVLKGIPAYLDKQRPFEHLQELAAAAVSYLLKPVPIYMIDTDKRTAEDVAYKAMGSNSFGQIFTAHHLGRISRQSRWSCIDGCPAGVELCEEEINLELEKRAPGKSPFTSPRKRESDQAELLSGVFEGKTTGTPISILIPNRDVDSSKYEPIKHLFRTVMPISLMKKIWNF